VPKNLGDSVARHLLAPAGNNISRPVRVVPADATCWDALQQQLYFTKPGFVQVVWLNSFDHEFAITYQVGTGTLATNSYVIGDEILPPPELSPILSGNPEVYPPGAACWSTNNGKLYAAASFTNYSITWRFTNSLGGCGVTVQASNWQPPNTYLLGQQIAPPAAAIGTNPPIVQPPSAAYWHAGTKTLYAATPNNNYSIHWQLAGSSSGCNLVVQAANSTWPTNVFAQIPTNQLGQALFGYLRLQAMQANDNLVAATSLAYDRTGSGTSATPVYSSITNAQAAELALVDAALGQLRAALRYVPYTPELRAYDQQQSLTGEASSVRTLVRVLQRFAEAAQLKGQILVTRTGGRPSTSAEYQAAENFLQSVQREFELHHLLLAHHLSEAEQAASGLTAASLEVDELQAALIRLQNFLPPSSGEVIYSKYAIPSPAVTAIGERQQAYEVVNQAISQWQQAQADDRQFDTDQTALRAELTRLSEQYLNVLASLTGEDPRQVAYTTNGQVFGSSGAIQLYLDKVFSPDWLGGELGVQRTLEERAGEAVSFARAEVDRAYDRMLIEERKLGQVSTVIIDNTNRLMAIDITRGKASTFSYQTKYRYRCPDGKFVWRSFYDPTPNCPRTNWVIVAEETKLNGKGNYNPGAEEVARLTAEERSIQAEQQLRIEGINSRATIDNLRLNQAQALGQSALAGKDFLAASLSSQQIESRILQTINAYLAADTNFTAAYFSNPVYRLLRDETVTRADSDLRLAQVVAYRFARRLEYEWAERWPVDLSTSTPEWQAKVGQWSFFLGGLETVFSTVTPHQVKDFLDALREWDRQLRDNRPPPQTFAPVYGQAISFRQHIIGYRDYNNFNQQLDAVTLQRNEELWRQYVASNVITNKVGGFDPLPIGGVSGPKNALLLRFPMQLLDPSSAIGTYFNAAVSYNHKIIAFDFNLIGTSGFNSGIGTAARLDLMQRGLVALRTYGNTQNGNDFSAVLFNADPYATNNTDRIWGNINFAIYNNVSINSANRPAVFYPGDGTQVMANRPVAATEWVLFIDNGRQFADVTLSFDRLWDIQILASYQYNSPPPIW
jgi:hypothetical protein